MWIPQLRHTAPARGPRYGLLLAAVAALWFGPGSAARAEQEIRCAALSPDSRTAVSGWSDGRVRLVDLGTGKTRATLTASADPIALLAFSRDGRLLATAAHYGDEAVRIWDTRTGRLLHTLPGGLAHPRQLAFSPDGTLLAGARARRVTPPGGRYSHDITGVSLWSTATGRHVLTQERADEPLLFTPDGKTLITGLCSSTPEKQGQAGGIILLDLVNLGQRKVLPADAPTSVDLALSLDGSILVAGAGETVQIWDPRTGELRRTLPGAVSWQWFALSPDGNALVTGAKEAGGQEAGRPSAPLLWNPRMGKRLAVLQDAGQQLSFSRDGSTLLTDGEGQTLHVWDTRTGRRRSTLRFRREDDLDTVDTLALSPDGRVAATGGSQNRLRLWDTQSGKLLSQRQRYPDQVRFSPNGRVLALREDNSLLFYDFRRPAQMVELGSAASSPPRIRTARSARRPPAPRAPKRGAPDRRPAPPGRRPAATGDGNRSQPDRFIFY